MPRPFRFGVSMALTGDRAHWVAKCCRAEHLGFDVISVPDHLGMPAPFPSLMLAASVTERIGIGTYVLNTGFHNPMLLTRDAFAVDEFSGGRLEIGLGAGYDAAEVERAGLPWLSPRQRVDRLTEFVDTLRAHGADESTSPRPIRPGGPRLVVAGSGDRVLRLAAERADVVAFSGVKPAPSGFSDSSVVGAVASPYSIAEAEVVDERVAYVRECAAGRTEEPELNIVLQSVVRTNDRKATAEELRGGSELTLNQLLEAPTLLFGTTEEMAEQLVTNRARFGISYVTVIEPVMEVFAEVIGLLRAERL
ncbi:TIGR03621 family F420-dependent LLM class oxidoreductase [Saccharothrix obliqua]|uniref:TIGR03621 family F420-dependent LLM class oxidoreductase n=1 Tax=Saccharothrix obliqua TaxID=2861747 RepID=UPI001C5EA1C1|nr:TIGR03621 family F420-dependent LLM class oxidoreductase [Saccharothrix obliqua]MBW4717857.1 TIGR03621 family F420-dependent LLM class oxidoreductase [Saccharothrix obliqua]